MSLEQPHTKQWFERMAKTNPAQAAMTAQFVKLAGRTDVCSICGDTDSAVYKTVDDPTLTLRLCTDCKKIQKEQFGLSVDPV